MTANPLRWYEGTDHPQDREGSLMAHGIGGRYSFDTQADGNVLLRMADDESVGIVFEKIWEAIEAAEKDWQEKYSALGAKP